MTIHTYRGSLTHLRAGGVSQVLNTRGEGLPAVLPLPGRVLRDVEVQIPAMFPDYLHLIRATAEAEGP